jgi:hypothetical protein
MKLGKRLEVAARAQFGRPTGLWGRAAGSLMAHRSSNRLRNAWAVSMLDVRPDDRVLEFGFGPGVAIRELARLASEGSVRDRPLRADAAAGREAQCRGAQARSREQVARLEELRRLLRSGGLIGVVHRPRGPRASDETAGAEGRRIEAALAQGRLLPGAGRDVGTEARGGLRAGPERAAR